MRGYHLSGIVAVIRTILLLLIDCRRHINPLNAELSPICHLLALLGAHHILHLSGIRVTLLYFAEPQSVGCSRQLKISDMYKHVME
jgi:hypothetical protein